MEGSDRSLPPGVPLKSDPAEIREIFERIDENLQFQPVLPETSNVVKAPELEPVAALIGWLRESSAPLQTTISVGGLRGIFLRGLNLPVKVFGAAQIEFNQKLRQFLGLLLENLEAQRTATDHLRQLYVEMDTVTELQMKVQFLEEVNHTAQTEIQNLRTELAALRREIEQISGSSSSPH